MKSMTPTEARKNWFRLLDEVAAGEIVQIRRGKKIIVLRCEAEVEKARRTDYANLIGGPDLENARPVELGMG